MCIISRTLTCQAIVGSHPAWFVFARLTGSTCECDAIRPLTHGTVPLEAVASLIVGCCPLSRSQNVAHLDTYDDGTVTQTFFFSVRCQESWCIGKFYRGKRGCEKHLRYRSAAIGSSWLRSDHCHVTNKSWEFSDRGALNGDPNHRKAKGVSTMVTQISGSRETRFRSGRRASCTFVVRAHFQTKELQTHNNKRRKPHRKQKGLKENPCSSTPTFCYLAPTVIISCFRGLLSPFIELTLAQLARSAPHREGRTSSKKDALK